MNGQTDFTVKAESGDFKNALFLAMELRRATLAGGDVRTAAWQQDQRACDTRRGHEAVA